MTPATATPKNLSEKRANEIFYLQILAGFLIGVVTIVIAAGIAWVLWESDWADYPTEDLVLLIFGPMSFALLLWSIFLGALLRGVFIGETGLHFLFGHFVLVEFLFLLSYLVLGDTGAMIVTWLGILVWNGFFGYSGLLVWKHKQINLGKKNRQGDFY